MQCGHLSIIGMSGSEEMAAKVNRQLLEWRQQDTDQGFLLKATCPRFSTGEAKALIHNSVRGHDLYIISDMFNYGVTYKMYGIEHRMSPDDHYQDLKRVISATGGKARRITVIMPLLYEGRQHRRFARESLDCALALQELERMGVSNLITFDAHDSRVQNAVPLSGFENVRPTYQMIKALLSKVNDLEIDPKKLMVVSPDEGGMSRCIYYSSVLGVELGMFYKVRDYVRLVNGRHPIIRHEFLGDNVEGKDIIIVDDMISSGDSVIGISRLLKKLKARRIFIFATFGQFTEGYERFDEAYAERSIERVFTTNLTYQPSRLLECPWHTSVDISRYIAYIVDTMNHDRSISNLLDPTDKINNVIDRFKNGEYKNN